MVFIAIEIVLTFRVFYKYQFEEIMTIMEPYHKHRFNLYYLRPHYRYMTWLIGMSFGFFMCKEDTKNLKLTNLGVMLGWVFALGVISAKLIYPWTQIGEKSVFNAAVYSSFGKMCWALSICMIIYLCERGYGGIFNSFLSSQCWRPLSRLSYAMYLVSFAVSKWNVGNSRISFTLKAKETVSFTDDV